MALTKILAGEGAPFNILVNAMLVGIIHADQHTQAAKARGVTLGEHLSQWEKAIPLQRIGEPEEFANMACFSYRIRRPILPGPRSISTAAIRLWCSSHTLQRINVVERPSLIRVPQPRRRQLRG